MIAKPLAAQSNRGTFNKRILANNVSTKATRQARPANLTPKNTAFPTQLKPGNAGAKTFKKILKKRYCRIIAAQLINAR